MKRIFKENTHQENQKVKYRIQQQLPNVPSVNPGVVTWLERVVVGRGLLSPSCYCLGRPGSPNLCPLVPVYCQWWKEMLPSLQSTSISESYGRLCSLHFAGRHFAVFDLNIHNSAASLLLSSSPDYSCEWVVQSGCRNVSSRFQVNFFQSSLEMVSACWCQSNNLVFSPALNSLDSFEVE